MALGADLRLLVMGVEVYKGVECPEEDVMPVAGEREEEEDAEGRRVASRISALFGIAFVNTGHPGSAIAKLPLFGSSLSQRKDKLACRQ